MSASPTLDLEKVKLWFSGPTGRIVLSSAEITLDELVEKYGSLFSTLEGMKTVFQEILGTWKIPIALFADGMGISHEERDRVIADTPLTNFWASIRNGTAKPRYKFVDGQWVESQ